MARSKSAAPYFSLDTYAEWFNLPTCAFNGIENSDETVSGCDHVWSQWERDMLARALARAENTLANQVRFYYGERFLTDTDLPWTDPTQLKYHYVTDTGALVQTAITPVASDFTTDPATITIAQANLPSGTDELKVLETIYNLEIHPDRIDTSGVNYVVYISQCKLVEWDDVRSQTTAAPVDYDAAFPGATWLKLADLSIYRETCSDSDQATITFGPSCACGLCGTAGTGSEHTGVVYVQDTDISRVRVQLADYDSTTGTWSCSYPELWGCYDGSKAQVHYKAGTTTVPGYDAAILALAHTYIVVEPCGCSLFRQWVQRDQRIPPTLTAERINCPFGEADGAWQAWQWAESNRHGIAILAGESNSSWHQFKSWLL